MGPAYANRRYTSSSGEETFADWQQRVTGDVFEARSALVAQGFDPVAFAVPGGDYGQAGTNDPRIAPYLRGLLATQFGQALVESDDPPFATRTGDATRLVVRASTSARPASTAGSRATSRGRSDEGAARRRRGSHAGRAVGRGEAARCPKPAHVSFTRKPGAATGRLSWQPPPGAPRGTRATASSATARWSARRRGARSRCA